MCAQLFSPLANITWASSIFHPAFIDFRPARRPPTARTRFSVLFIGRFFAAAAAKQQRDRLSVDRANWIWSTSLFFVNAK